VKESKGARQRKNVKRSSLHNPIVKRALKQRTQKAGPRGKGKTGKCWSKERFSPLGRKLPSVGEEGGNCKKNQLHVRGGKECRGLSCKLISKETRLRGRPLSIRMGHGGERERKKGHAGPPGSWGNPSEKNQQEKGTIGPRPGKRNPLVRTGTIRHLS